MSFNQSRSDKNEGYNQYRKSGRSNNFNPQRGSSGTHSKPGGAGGSAPSPSIASNRGFKKTNNAQGGQSRAVNSTDSSNAPNLRGVQNATSDAWGAGAVAKPVEPPHTQRTTRDVPKDPTSQSPALISDGAAPTTPARGTGDQFSFQFGSISPGFMNGMQLPVRTSSAPPNLDEQKRDQARRHESFRSGPPMPVPIAPKPQAQRKDAGAGDQPNTGQHLPQKDAGIINQPNTGDGHTVQKVKKDVQASPNHPMNPIQKPTPPMSGVPMTMPYHLPQGGMPFGGPNQQMQSQGVTPPTSMHMPIPMPLQIGSNPQVQQPMFVPGLHPHPMQPQGIIHQGQGLGFATQIGPQLPQLSNLGINVTPQFPQPQGGKFGGPRKSAVRITDPNTHEELIFDNKQTNAYTDTGSSGPRPPFNLTPQTQPLPFAPNHAMNFYPNSFNPNSLYFASPSSLPLPSGQTAPSSQPLRFNYPVNQGSQNVSYVDMHVKKPGGGPMHGISEPLNREHTLDTHSLHPAPVHVTIKMPPDPIGGKVSVTPPNRIPTTEEGKSKKPSTPLVEVVPPSSQRAVDTSSESSLHNSKVGKEPSLMKSSPVVSKMSTEAPPVVSLNNQDSSSMQSSLTASSEEPGTHNEGRRKNLSRSDSHKDHQKKTNKKGYAQSQHQISGQSPSELGLPDQLLDTTSHSSVVEAQSQDVILEGKSEAVEEAKSSTIPVVVESKSESASVVTSDSLKSKDAILASVSQSSLENSSLGNVENADLISDDKQGTSKEKHSEPVLLRTEEQGQATSSELPVDIKNSKNLSDHDVAKPVEVAEEATTVSNEVSTYEAAERAAEEPVSCHAGVDVSASVSSSSAVLENSHSDKVVVDSSGKNDIVSSNEVALKEGVRTDQPSEPALNMGLSEGKIDGEALVTVGTGGHSSHVVSGPKDKSVVETSRSKNTGKGKKKLKAILQMADAAGTTSDLYMAYKRPEEKKEAIAHSEGIERTESRSSLDIEQESIEAVKEDARGKAEPDDWEDAADITPKLESAHGDAAGASVLDGGDRMGDMSKKYSKDFLLKFAEQFVDLPHNFEVTPDIESLMSSHASASHHPDYPSPGRVDRPSSGGSRLDRRGGNMGDDDRWSKSPGQYVSGPDPRMDLAYGPNAGFRPGQGANFGVLRNPRAQTPVQYAGGILAGPMQSMGPQGGMRNNSDADRWQRATNIQLKGLIPLTPLQTMHKAKRKYEIGKVSDEEEAKQRQLKAILNKLTPQNFEKLFEQVKAVNIDNGRTLTGVISQIFDKALTEPTFCEMYANFCFHLAGELPDLSEDNEKITFKRLLLNKCQEEFERGEREQEEANKVEEEGEVKQSEEQREEKRTKARRRMLGNIRLIGELYKKKMLTERIMHECINKLMGAYQNPNVDPDEENVEALCKLMSTIGEMIDHPRAKEFMDSYFDIMARLSNNMALSSRVRFMLRDIIDLRKNKWQTRRKIEGPKKIEEVHRDAAQERQAQTGRFGRGPGVNTSARRGGQPMDYGPRGSAMSSPNTQMGGFRGYPHQARGYGNHDARQDERQAYEARALSTLPHRAAGDDSITLGPQGGLARGMSSRGPQPSSVAPAEMAPLAGDLRSAPTASLNGYSSASERAALTSKEDQISRHVPEKFGGPTSFDHVGGQDRYSNYGNKDLRHSVSRSSDRSRPISPATPPPTSTSEKVLSEDRLRELSLTAIKEFYSARDEKEVAMCIKDLNSPAFHPIMISLWVTDAFERTDLERDLLAKLVVNLSRSNDGTLNQAHLVKGFEAVLATLEDAVNDAPRAPEYLGRILGKVITESMVSLRKVGDLIYEGGEEPGGLLQAGLAADVLGNVLKAIRTEKGEGFLNDMRMNSNLQLETFRPTDPMKSSRVLEEFI